MSTVDWLLCAAALPALLLGLRYAIGLVQLRALRLSPRAAAAVNADEVPIALREALADGLAALADLGFTDCRWFRMPTLLVTRLPCEQWFAVGFHPIDAALGAIVVSDAPEAGWLWEPSFATHFEDRSVLMTTDGRAHALAPFREQLALADDYTGSIAAAWAAHRSRVAQHGGERLRDRALLAERDVALGQAMFETARARGRLEWGADGHYRLSWRGALDYLREYQRGMQRRAGALAKRRAAAPVTTTPTLLAAVDAVAMTPGLLAAKGDTLSFGGRCALLAATAALSFVAFAATAGVAFASCLLATLALHEAGHFLMMKRYDYANLKVFFVPFLGAAVSGDHPEATAGQRIAIYLAGPLPGMLLGGVLVAGLAGGWWTASSTGWTLAILLLAINYTNLLPFEPLDGGRIVGLLWFARHPRLRIATFALGLCPLVALAVASESKAFLVFCALVALGLPHLYRQSRLLQAVRAGEVSRDDREAIATLYARLAVIQPALPHAQRLAVVKGLLPELRLPLPTRGEIAWGSLVYLLALGLPFGVVAALEPSALLAIVR